jgi:nicotinate phosphoribosyltransferase
VHAYPEGELFFPDSPIVRVAGTFGETVLLETIVLSILNHDCAVAAAASRIVHAAAERPCVDMGGRRTHEDAAVDAARAAYIAGFAATSNLEAGRRFAMPTMGTAAHAFTLVHDDELIAFRAQLAALGSDTTLLVDTYDTEAGIRNAVAAANEIGCDGPGAVRIDSGDFVETTRQARALLDHLGAHATKIVVSGDLDEFEIARLENARDVDGRGRAPIDSYGVGTRLVTGSGHPTAGFVYKLVDVDGRAVAKHSVGKATVGGDKRAYRRFGSDGRACAELLVVGDDDIGADARPLEVAIYVNGDAVEPPDLGAARAQHVRACAEFPPETFAVEPGAPALRATLTRAAAKEEVRD